MKRRLHYIIESIYPANEANKIAKIEMVNAFTKIDILENVYFYFLYKYGEKKQTIDFTLTVINKNIHLKFSGVPFINTGTEYLGGIFQKIKAFAANRIIIFVYFFKILFLKINNNDMFFIRGENAVISCYLCSFFRHKLKFSFEVHNFQFNGFKKISSFRSRLKLKNTESLMKKIMKKAEFIVTVSDFARQNWIDEGINQEKILVLPSGVDFDKIDSIKINKKDLRNMLGLPADKKIICYTGKLDSGKGIEFLLEAASNMPDYLFILAGGKLEQIEFYKKYCIQKFPEISNVIFTGFIPHEKIVYYLKSVDILAAPYSRKCEIINTISPIKLFEYIASKNPVIVSDFPRIRDIVSSEDVVFFESDNLEDFIDKIELIFDNYNGYLDKSEKVYDKVKKYSWTERSKTIINRVFYL